MQLLSHMFRHVSSSIEALDDFFFLAYVSGIMFETAYRQLQPHERVFVDAYVGELEKQAVRENIRLTSLLASPLPVADPRARDMLDLALVRAAIAERVRELQEDAELNIYRTLKELRSIAYSNISNYFTIGSDGIPMPDFSGATPEQLAAVKSIDIEEKLNGRKIKITLHDKLQALIKTMQYQGLLDGDGDHWRTVNAAEQKKIAASDGVDDAANIYARMIGG